MKIDIKKFKEQVQEKQGKVEEIKVPELPSENSRQPIGKSAKPTTIKVGDKELAWDGRGWSKATGSSDNDNGIVVEI